MPNPFPGVDPFIEATSDFWVGFHNVLIGDISKLLNATLVPRGYAAIVDKRIELVDEAFYDDDTVKQIRGPDVGLIEIGGQQRHPLGTGSSALLDVEPTPVENPELDPIPVAFIEIWSHPDQELVTGIELLSPSNKIGRRVR